LAREQGSIERVAPTHRERRWSRMAKKAKKKAGKKKK